MTSEMPLSGLLVADFSRVLAGPLATCWLADLGARVVKVERPGSGDDTRTWGPPWTDNSSSYFHAANRNKESIELDLRLPGDLGPAQRLAQRSDIVVENFREGTLSKLGLGYDQVSKDNPGVIYASITGCGSRQGAKLAGYDLLVQAVGGLMSITGTPESGPLKVGVALVDVLASRDAVIGILSAVRVRDRTGHGQRVEVKLLSTLLGALANQAAALLTTGRNPGLMGNRHPSIAPYETLEASDGKVVVCVGNDVQFHRLTQVLALGGLSSDPRFVTNEMRLQHRDELRDLLEQRLRTDTASAWIHFMNEVGVPAGKVNSIAEGIEFARTLGLRPTVEVGGSPAQVRNPITLSTTPIERYDAPPRLGEHNSDLRDWLAREP